MASVNAHRNSSPRRSGEQFGNLPTGMQLVALVAAILVLLAVLYWLVQLEKSLPRVHSPGPGAQSELIDGSDVLVPGTYDASQLEPRLTGDWVLQEIGESTWFATDEAGSGLRAAFYGTDLQMLVRVGPDAGRAYVTIDGQSVEHLPNDESGSYVGMWAGEASNRTILLVTGLAHEEHTVTITSDESGELAIASLNVTARTPFPWAFMLGYAGIGGSMLLVVRQLVMLAASGNRPTARQERASGE